MLTIPKGAHTHLYVHVCVPLLVILPQKTHKWYQSRRFVLVIGLDESLYRKSSGLRVRQAHTRGLKGIISKGYS